MRLKRTSNVGNINLTSLTIGSSFEIGDSVYIQSISRALAVQREVELFFDDEGNFSDFPIFQRPILLPPITEPFTYESMPKNLLIKVGKITIIAVSSASVLHIGSSRHINMESRIKHIRHLQPRE
jgi:spore germination protein PE